MSVTSKRTGTGVLRTLTPDLVLTAGLGADFGAECMRLTRYLDTGGHDPSKWRMKQVDLERRLQELFVEKNPKP